MNKITGSSKEATNAQGNSTISPQRTKRRELFKDNHFWSFRKLPDGKIAQNQITSYRKFIDKDLRKLFQEDYLPRTFVDYNNTVYIKILDIFINEKKLTKEELLTSTSEYIVDFLISVDWDLKLVQIQKRDFEEISLKEQLEFWLSEAFLIFKSRGKEDSKPKVKITQVGQEFTDQEGRKNTQWTVTANNQKSDSDEKDLFQLTLNASHHDEDPRIKISFKCQHIKQIEVCSIPKIDKHGCFNINGHTKTIVLQSVRAPGVYSFFPDESNDPMLAYGEIIAFKGPWVSFNYENNRQKGTSGQILKLKFLSTKTSASLAKVLDTVDVKLSSEQVDKFFGDDEGVRSSLLTVKHLEDEQEFSTKAKLPRFLFDGPNPYFLIGEIGRKKFKVLNVLRRISGQKLAEDLTDQSGNVFVKSGTIVTPQIIEIIRNNLPQISDKNNVNIANAKSLEKLFVFEVFAPSGKVVKVLGPSEDNDHQHFDISDLLSSVSYFSNVRNGLGTAHPETFKDNLGNQMIRRIGDLLYNIFDGKLGAFINNVSNKYIASISQLKFANLFKIPSLSEFDAAIKSFFNISTLAQLQNETNPVAEISNLRKMSVLGHGGFNSVNANMAVRNVNPSHYGRIDLVETPEGQKVGLLHTLSSGVEIDKYGQLVAPYYKVVDGVVTSTVDYLTVDDEVEKKICNAKTLIDDQGVIKESKVTCRYKNIYVSVSPSEIDYIDYSFYHVGSWTSNSVPFNGNVSSGRSSQSVNMIKQACPIIDPEVPLIATGAEVFTFENSRLNIRSEFAGTVSYIDSQKIVTVDSTGKSNEQSLTPYYITNKNSLLYYKSDLKVGDKVSVNSLVSYGNYGTNGEISLGRNLRVGFVPASFNFEDGILISASVDLTTVFVKKYQITRNVTRHGEEIVTKEHLSQEDAKKLDADGIIKEGSEVNENDILVGKRSPSPGKRGETEELLIADIFNNKLNIFVDSSFRMPWGESGKVSSVTRRVNTRNLPLTSKKGSNVGFNSNNLETIEISVSTFRNLEVGDKLTSRFGNKGVVARIVPVWEMPFDSEGRPLDVVFNPLGIPSRMNIGQIFEAIMGSASQKIGDKFLVRPFDSPDNQQIAQLLKEADIKDYGMRKLYDGRTGLPYASSVMVGVFYVMKLNHMVADKEHSRNTGKYSLYHSQPLKGRSKEGGQRMGEMERNAIEGYGASHFEAEMMGPKSDDVRKRKLIKQQIIYGDEYASSLQNHNESFNSLLQYLWALGIRFDAYDSKNRKIDPIREFFDRK